MTTILPNASWLEHADLPPQGAPGGDPAPWDPLPPEASAADEMNSHEGPPGSPGAAPSIPLAVINRKGALAAKAVRATKVQPLLSSPYLVKGWLDLGAMSVVYGESNVGKSFFALSIAHNVSKGDWWAGCRVMGGPVFYVASEGGRSFVNRLAALEGPSDRLVVIPVSVDLCGSALDAEALSALIRDEAQAHGDPALLVIDTLARSMGQGDENAAPDMGAFVRNVDVIREKTSAHVMVIHHSGKDRAKGARGHSSLRAATDTEIELSADGDTVIAEAKKQRDMANGRRFAYRLAEVELGRDQDGDPVTTCRVEPCDAPAATRRLTPSARLGIETFLVAARNAGRSDDLSAAVHVEDWRPTFYEKSTADTVNAKRVAFQRVRSALVDSGDMAVADDVYTLKRVPPEGAQ